uniref:Ig-like domain-containing protein n=1 Tax=Cyprinodon variegatus TaxID=28743 RepID=A0A3Q2CMM1_CYPVA
HIYIGTFAGKHCPFFFVPVGVKCEQLTQPDSVNVQPGQRLTISCQVSYSVTSYWTGWIRQAAGKGLEWIGCRVGSSTSYKDSLKNKFSIDIDSSRNTATLNGQNMQPEDTAVYYYHCVLTFAFSFSATQHAPTVFPLIPCGSGGSDMVTLGCLATGFNPPSITFSWQQGNTNLDNFIQYPSIQKGSEYVGISQVQVRRQDWEANNSFKCVANHAAGQQHVFQAPTLKVCSSVDEDKEEAYFSCFAKDFTPNKYEITWKKDDKDISERIDEVNTSAQGRNDTNGTILYSVGSLLTLKTTEVLQDTKITCIFKGKGENNTPVYRNATVSHKECTATEGCLEADVDVTIIPPTLQDMFEKGQGKLICQAKFKRGRFETIFWEKTNDNTKLVGTNRTLGSRTYEAETEITYDEWRKGETYTCEIQNKDWIEPLRKEYNRNNNDPNSFLMLAGKEMKRPSVFMLPPVEQPREKTVILTCYVKGFYPQEVYVAWLVDDEANTIYSFNTTEPVEVDGSFSVYSQLVLTTEEWEQTDVVYSCAVQHESLAKPARSIVRSIGYRTFKNTNVVNLSMNVPEKCKA